MLWSNVERHFSLMNADNLLSVRFATSLSAPSCGLGPCACTPTCRRRVKKTGIEMRQYPAALQRYLMTKSSVHSYAIRIFTAG